MDNRFCLPISYLFKTGMVWCNWENKKNQVKLIYRSNVKVEGIGKVNIIKGRESHLNSFKLMFN